MKPAKPGPITGVAFAAFKELALRTFERTDFTPLWTSAMLGVGSADQGDDLESMLTIDAQGAWLNREAAGGLGWTWLAEFRGDDQPHPESSPALGFPFSACELAMFMLNGPGYFLAQVVGGFGTASENLNDPVAELAKSHPRSALAIKRAREAYSLAAEKCGDREIELHERLDLQRSAAAGLLFRDDAHKATRSIDEREALWRRSMVLYLSQARQVPRLRQSFAGHRDQVLRALKQLGHDPKAVVATTKSEAGSKGLARAVCVGSGSMTERVFVRTWAAMREGGEIVDGPTEARRSRRTSD